MSRAWLLPEHLADVLPAQARQLEVLRRRFIDEAVSRGFELVIPPLLEHLDSLLTGTGRELDLRTFKLVDQLGGRTLGVRADTTPQAARIDAHLLNREGVTRLCYCGPVLHTRPAAVDASREPLQFGAEIFGHAGLEADIEVIELAVEALAEAGLEGLTLDLADARILRGLLAGALIEPERLQDVVAALSHKDGPAVRSLTADFPQESREGLRALLDLYGGADVLEVASARLPDRAPIRQAVHELGQLAGHLKAVLPTLTVGVDLADAGGYAYYSGARFALFGGGSADALARGGRYDEVGAVFGRNRPAAGFSVDLKRVAASLPPALRPLAVRAPWGEAPGLRAAVRKLREGGDTVIRALPGEGAEGDVEFDRELAAVADRWVLRSL